MADQQLKDLTATTTPADTDILYSVVDPAGTPLDRKITWGSVKTFLKTYFDGIYSTITVALGKKNYHGIEASGAISFDNSTHILTMGAGTNTYWFQGVKYTTASAITCDIDSFITLTANTLYYVYFDDATGTLKASTSFWNLKTQVPVATIYWNGSAGSISKETHGYQRDVDWHIWAHSTVGTRYGSGLTLSLPTTTTDGSLQIGAGSLYDEDLLISISQQTTMRGYYQASAGVYTWADYSLPYLGTAGAPVYLDTDTYTLTTYANDRFACYWVFATNDQDKPIAIIPSQISDTYTTVPLARAELQPSISGLNPEWKLIYRFIYAGDGQLQESSDYRLQTSLAGGVSASSSASSVSFSPAGTVQATNVQTAIEELDTEKENVANKVTSFQTTPDNTHYPSEKLTYDQLALKASLTGAETLTNKRITQRVLAITSSATPTINTDNYDAVTITALEEEITSFTTNLSGTPTNFQKLIIRIKDNGTAQAITWGASFSANGVALPTTTVISKLLTVGFIYDTVTSKWGCVAVAQE